MKGKGNGNVWYTVVRKRKKGEGSIIIILKLL